MSVQANLQPELRRFIPEEKKDKSLYTPRNVATVAAFATIGMAALVTRSATVAAIGTGAVIGANILHGRATVKPSLKEKCDDKDVIDLSDDEQEPAPVKPTDSPDDFEDLSNDDDDDNSVTSKERYNLPERYPYKTKLGNHLHERMKRLLASVDKFTSKKHVFGKERILTKDTLERMLCLKDSGWANDQILNTFIPILRNEALSDCFIPTTFFMNHISSSGKTPEQIDRSIFRQYICDSNGACISDKVEPDYTLLKRILVPISTGAHWFFAEANLEKGTIEMHDSIKGSVGSYMQYTSKIETYLKGFAARKNIEVPKGKWNVTVNTKYPQQPDGRTCGFYTLVGMQMRSQKLEAQFDEPRKTVIEHFINVGERYLDSLEAS